MQAAADPGAEQGLLHSDAEEVVAEVVDVAAESAERHRLLEAIRELNPSNLMSDDTTVMLLRANGSGVRFIENLKAPLRILQGLWQTYFRSA